MEEKSERKCKWCEKNFVRIQKGRYKSGQIRYVDENGKITNGKLCATCNKTRAYQAMKKLRNF